jgi:hypothetical protein
VAPQIAESVATEVVRRGFGEDPRSALRVVGPSTTTAILPEADSATEMPCLTSPTTEPVPTSFDPC